jgi:transposase-like protein
MTQAKSTDRPINGKQPKNDPDPEVVPRAKRRRFSAAYKRQILEEIDQCQQHGEIGAVLRREGLYSSHISQWRRQRDQGQLTGSKSKKRGRKPDPQAAEMARLQRENEQLKARLQQAETIIDVQKKLSRLLGLPTDESQKDEPK